MSAGTLLSAAASAAMSALLRAALLGSIARQVIHLADVPVTLVK